MDLPAKTKIGPGFCITHGWGSVVSGGAVLGSNVTLFHGATIGQGDKIAPDGSRQVGYPVIEDDVWIGPNATVVGRITVGTGSRIMPGAVVSFDVPPRSIVAGNPATVVKENCCIDVNNRVQRPSAAIMPGPNST
jgi:serine O-acetyltransferase